MMLELTTEKLQIKIDGAPYELRYPTVSDSIKFEGATDDIKTIKDYLESLGLPAGVFETLQTDHVKAIVFELVKKKD